MKLPTPSMARGSMGIPEEIHPDTLRRQREEAEAEREARRDTPRGDDGFAAGRVGAEADAADEDEETPKTPPKEGEKDVQWGGYGHPLANLKKIGVELSPEDFNHLIFKGYLQKTLPLAVNPVTKEDITVTFKTLTPAEYDEIDECLAEECSALKVTGDGVSSRRSSWTMAFAMTGMMGREFVKPTMRKDEVFGEVVDTKATAKHRKKYVAQLYSETVNRAIGLYDTLTVNLRLIMGDPKQAFFGKP